MCRVGGRLMSEELGEGVGSWGGSWGLRRSWGQIRNWNWRVVELVGWYGEDGEGRWGR